MKKALIVVDLQNYFIDQSTMHLVEGIKKAIESKDYEEVVFTRFINRPDSSFVRNGWSGCMESPETDICPMLKPYLEDAAVFEKYGFSAFRADGMHEYLKRKGITEIHLCGTDTDACVLASAYDGFELGYDVEIIEELCASRNGKEYHQMGLSLLRKNLAVSADGTAKR